MIIIPLSLLLLLLILYQDGHDDIQWQSKILFCTKIYFPLPFSVYQGISKRENWIRSTFVSCLLYIALLLRRLMLAKPCSGLFFYFSSLGHEVIHIGKESSPSTSFILREEQYRRPYFPMSTHWGRFFCKLMAPKPPICKLGNGTQLDWMICKSQNIKRQKQR